MVTAGNLAWIDDGWEGAALPSLSFAIESLGGGWAPPTSVEGIVRRVDEERLHIGTPGFREERAHVPYHLPASLDLRPLVGRRVVVDIAQGSVCGGRPGRTLTICGDTGRLWLAAHHGRDPFWQSLGGVDLCVSALEGGDEMSVVGPSGHRQIVERGDHVRLSWGTRAWVVEFVSSFDSGEVAYVVADACLWH